MNLRHAVLCIDCDEVFTVEKSPCNPRCPICGSSVFAPLSAWVRTWVGFERSLGETVEVAPVAEPVRRRVMELVPPAPIAA